jgi:uncharacterized protein YciI
MPFLVIATDHTDDQALQRRLDARPHHLSNALRLETAGILTFAGASVDSEGKMTGSVLVLNVATRGEASSLIESDLYWTSKVWASYTLQDMRIAIPSGHK